MALGLCAGQALAQLGTPVSYPDSVVKSYIAAADPGEPHLKTVRVYKATFEDRYVENDGVIDAVPYNKYMRQEKVNYLAQPIGYRQDLYLLQLVTTSSSIKFIYFAVWYKKGNEFMGFGPAYAGTMDLSKNNITFSKGLVLKKDASYPGSLRLISTKRSRKFVMTMPAKPDTSVIVNRIVLFENNKIGGRKRIVFHVSDHLKMDDLVFERQTPDLTP
jgi:hypothetical protein